MSQLYQQRDRSPGHRKSGSFVGFSELEMLPVNRKVVNEGFPPKWSPNGEIKNQLREEVGEGLKGA
jgi:hypothetical protein